MKPKFVILPLFLFTFAFLGVWQSADLYRQSAAAYFNQANLGSDDFRRMQPGSYVMEQLRTDAEQTGLSPHEVANLVEQVQNLTRRVKKYESWEE